MARLRKAAFVLASLPREEAEAVLARLPAGQLEAVVSEIATLGAAWSSERQAAMIEFAEACYEAWRLRECHSGHADARDSHSPEPSRDRAPWDRHAGSGRVKSDELEGGGSGEGRAVEGGSKASPPREVPLRWLADMPPREAAAYLVKERLSVIASVIAQLPQGAGVGVLAELPRDRQSEVIQRMAMLEPISPDVATDLSDALKGAIGWEGIVVATVDQHETSRTTGDAEQQADSENFAPSDPTVRPPTLAATAG